MFKRISIFACALALAAMMVAAPAGAKKASSKPAKAYWYSTKKDFVKGDFYTHVSTAKSNTLDFLGVNAGCTFYKSYPLPNGAKLDSKNKLKVDTTIDGYSNKDKVSTVITIKIDAKFKDGKFKGTYTISDPSSECTAAQKAEHHFTAKKRVKQTGG
jgi:hypothetical protein